MSAFCPEGRDVPFSLPPNLLNLFKFRIDASNILRLCWPDFAFLCLPGLTLQVAFSFMSFVIFNYNLVLPEEPAKPSPRGKPRTRLC